MAIIEVKNVSKRFFLKPQVRRSALGRILDFFSPGPKKELVVLRDVSLTVQSGEIVGVIGLNGSGKSTLLRLIAGIYQPDRGVIEVKGRIISVIGFYHGLNQRLTMRDNILASCSLYGLPPSVTKAQIKNITEFAELENYLYEPLYKFSSGMLARLVFSIVIHCIMSSQARILLLDEVFAVGDIEFINKSLNKLKEIFKSELTILMVSHDLVVMAKECNRVIWLGSQGIVKEGKSDEVVEAYKFSSSR
jgi:ABC-type polysaccharide/polyol phosphate transport system ATPase subunit